ncbi:MAG: hypothetical protein IPL27_15105 [Lewinellaceae bacterium]|nr:hypothetical protein [Lewinellaceae bacterium]
MEGEKYSDGGGLLHIDNNLEIFSLSNPVQRQQIGCGATTLTYANT